MYEKFQNIKELENSIRKLKDQEDLGEFLKHNLECIAHLTKPRTEMLQYEDGFHCSNCGYILTDGGVCLEHCPNCLESFACCDTTEEPCHRCYENAKALVREIYEGIISFED